MPARKVVLTRPTRNRTTEFISSSTGEGNGGVFSPSIEGGRKNPSTQLVGPSTKSESQLQQVLDLANKLTRAEQKKLYEHLALALATSDGGQDRDLGMWATAAYD